MTAARDVDELAADVLAVIASATARMDTDPERWPPRPAWHRAADELELAAR